MATYGVSYGGSRNTRSYGVGRRSLAGLYGGQRSPVQPRPTAAAFNPISDTLSSLQAANQARLNTVAPPAAAQTFGGVDPNRAGGPNPYVAPPAPNTTVPTPGGGGGTTDLSADPILTQIKALGQRGVQDAASQGTTGSKNDLINYGSVNVPQSLRDLFATSTPTNDSILGALPGNPVLAALNDANTAAAAAGNPFSILKQLSGAHDTNVHGIDQATNLANLYYSSTHANQLGQENQNYLGSQNTAANNLASLLSGENQGFLTALGGAHDQYLGALPAAYQRALDAGGSGSTAPAPGTLGSLGYTSVPAPYTLDTQAGSGALGRLVNGGGGTGPGGQPDFAAMIAALPPNLARILYR